MLSWCAYAWVEECSAAVSQESLPMIKLTTTASATKTLPRFSFRHCYEVLCVFPTQSSIQTRAEKCRSSTKFYTTRTAKHKKPRGQDAEDHSIDRPIQSEYFNRFPYRRSTIERDTNVNIVFCHRPSDDLFWSGLTVVLCRSTTFAQSHWNLSKGSSNLCLCRVETLCHWSQYTSSRRDGSRLLRKTMGR